MAQKVLKVDSSAAATIPKKSLEELGLKIGDRAIVDVDFKRNAVIIDAAKGIDREFLDWTRKFIKKYKSALDALAKK